MCGLNGKVVTYFALERVPYLHTYTSCDLKPITHIWEWFALLGIDSSYLLREVVLRELVAVSLRLSLVQGCVQGKGRRGDL